MVTQYQRTAESKMTGMGRSHERLKQEIYNARFALRERGHDVSQTVWLEEIRLIDCLPPRLNAQFGDVDSVMVNGKPVRLTR